MYLQGVPMYLQGVYVGTCKVCTCPEVPDRSAGLSGTPPCGSCTLQPISSIREIVIHMLNGSNSVILKNLPKLGIHAQKTVTHAQK
jgi:hypothetical protein